MQGSPEVIEMLNDILTAELTAVNQYFIHARMCDNWGLDGLAAKFREESIDEMRDAEAIMDRILHLEGLPNMQRLNPISIGETVPEQLRADLALEVAAVDRYNAGVALAVAHGDNGTRDLLERQLVDEEAHADWLEAQIGLIETVGVENYLTRFIPGQQ
jgi:bacterioferritin